MRGAASTLSNSPLLGTCWEICGSVENWSSVINKMLRRVFLKTANCRVEGVGNHCRGLAGVSQPASWEGGARATRLLKTANSKVEEFGNYCRV